MALELFKVGSNDYTNNIINGSFEINKLDVYEEWTNANWEDIQENIRTRIQGSFKMRFRTEASFDAFITYIATQKATKNYYPCTIWCNNTRTHETANLYLDFKVSVTQTPALLMDYTEFTMTVKEV